MVSLSKASTRISIAVLSVGVFLSAFLVLNYLTSSTRAQQSLTADDFFVKLIENTADLTEGVAIFEVRNPLPTALAINADTFRIRVENRPGATPVKSIRYYLLENVTYSDKVTDYAEECVDVATPSNTTGEDVVTKSCTSKASGWHWNIYTKEEWKSLDGYTFQPGQTYRIKIVATWSPQIGLNSREWIPMVRAASQNFEQSKWAWWDVSWQKKVVANVSNSNAYNYTNAPFEKLVTFATHPVNITNELRVYQCATEKSGDCTSGSLVESDAYNTTMDGSGYSESANILFLGNVSSASWRLYEIYYNYTAASYPSAIVADLSDDGTNAQSNFYKLTYNNSGNGPLAYYSVGGSKSYGNEFGRLSFEGWFGADRGATAWNCTVPVKTNLRHLVSCFTRNQTGGSADDVTANYTLLSNSRYMLTSETILKTIASAYSYRMGFGGSAFSSPPYDGSHCTFFSNYRPNNTIDITACGDGWQADNKNENVTALYQSTWSNPMYADAVYAFWSNDSSAVGSDSWYTGKGGGDLVTIALGGHQFSVSATAGTLSTRYDRVWMGSASSTTDVDNHRNALTAANYPVYSIIGNEENRPTPVSTHSMKRLYYGGQTGNLSMTILQDGVPVNASDITADILFRNETGAWQVVQMVQNSSFQRLGGGLHKATFVANTTLGQYLANITAVAQGATVTNSTPFNVTYTDLYFFFDALCGGCAGNA